MLNWFKKDRTEQTKNIHILNKKEIKKLLDKSDSRLAEFEKVLINIRKFCEENNFVYKFDSADNYLKKMVELNKQRKELDYKLDELIKNALSIDQSYSEQTKLFHEELEKIQKHLEG